MIADRHQTCRVRPDEIVDDLGALRLASQLDAAAGSRFVRIHDAPKFVPPMMLPGRCPDKDPGACVSNALVAPTSVPTKLVMTVLFEALPTIAMP